MAGVGSSRFRRGGRRARLCVAPEWGAGGKGRVRYPSSGGGGEAAQAPGARLGRGEGVSRLGVRCLC